MRLETLRNFFEIASFALTGRVPKHARPHADFGFPDKNGWFYTTIASAGFAAEDTAGSLKLVAFLNGEHLAGLDDCPYAAKLGLNQDPETPYKYCLVVFPIKGVEDIDEVQEWAAQAGLPDCVVYSHAVKAPQGGWLSGSRVSLG